MTSTIHAHVPAGGVRPPVLPGALDRSPSARHAREIAEAKAGRRGRAIARRVRGLVSRTA